MTAGRGGTILVAEDENRVRELTARILSKHGYSVYAASRPVEAVAIAADLSSIDLLLTDVVMPEMSGKELAALLAERRPDLKVLYMSGYPEDVIAHQGALDPGIALLEKPFTKQALLERVREVIARAPR